MGNTIEEGGEVTKTIDDNAPEFGYGHIITKMVNKVKKYKVEFFPRVKFTKITTDGKTRGESVEFGTTSVEATVYPLQADFNGMKAGTWEKHQTFATETEAEAYLAEVKVWAEQVQASWTVLAGVKKRILELHDLTDQLLQRSDEKLTKLEGIAPVFNPSDQEHVKLFQQCAILAKSMSELAQTPILDNEGNLSSESVEIAGKTQKILNSEL
jgi:hypothetical protein